MKYSWSIILFVAMAVSGFAQEIEQQVNHQVQSAVVRRDWQILEILGFDEMSLKDRLGELQPLIRSGQIKQAVILDGNREEQNLYKLLLKNNKVTALKTPLSAQKPLAEALQMAFDQLESGPRLRTGIFVSAHGNGTSMLYREQSLTVQQITAQIQRKKLDVDILEIDACNMGNILSLYELSKSRTVKYVVAASSLLCGNYVIPNPSFAAYLPDTKTALESVLQVRLAQHQKWGFSYTNNMFVINAVAVAAPLREWVKVYRQLQKANPQLAQELMNFRDENQEDQNWYSLTELLKWQRAQLKKREFSGKEDFVNKTRRLADALEGALVDQWCYSHPKKQVFRGKAIPAKSGCLNGAAASAEYINSLVAQ